MRNLFTLDKKNYKENGTVGRRPSVRESQQLDDYEEEEQFVLEFVTPEHAIEVNTNADHGEKAQVGMFAGMIERENRVLEIVREEVLKVE